VQSRICKSIFNRDENSQPVDVLVFGWQVAEDVDACRKDRRA